METKLVEFCNKEYILVYQSIRLGI